MRSILYRADQLVPLVLSSYLVKDSGVDAAGREGAPPPLGSDPGIWVTHASCNEKKKQKNGVGQSRGPSGFVLFSTAHVDLQRSLAFPVVGNALCGCCLEGIISALASLVIADGKVTARLGRR